MVLSRTLIVMPHGTCTYMHVGKLNWTIIARVGAKEYCEGCRSCEDDDHMHVHHNVESYCVPIVA